MNRKGASRDTAEVARALSEYISLLSDSYSLISWYLARVLIVVEVMLVYGKA